MFMTRYTIKCKVWGKALLLIIKKVVTLVTHLVLLSVLNVHC